MLYSSPGVQTTSVVGGTSLLNYNYGFTTLIVGTNHGVAGSTVIDLTLDTYYTWGLTYSGSTTQSGGGRTTYTRIA